jgi:mannose-6-phosphate isomerase-like protein (cupin superfamily)
MTRVGYVVAALGVACALGLAGVRATGQEPVASADVPPAPTDRASFWGRDDIEARWRNNESRSISNSRLFNGPTNISANVRIVLPNDPPQVHDVTADLWLVTAGSATAETDGELITTNDVGTIRNGTRRAVRAGDMLYVPPGVPHHFVDVKGFRAFLIRFDTVRNGPPPTVPAPAAPTDKTTFWSSADLEARWKNNESQSVSNSRLFNGPTNISANVRIVLPNDPPQVHDTTADLWITTAGTATAVTDGQLVTGDVPSIRDGVRRAIRAGDLLYVPPGVAHNFVDVIGFRAFLIRFDTK